MAEGDDKKPRIPDPRGDAFMARLERKQAAQQQLAKQSWSEFFRGYVIQIALIAVGIALIALVFWLLR